MPSLGPQKKRAEQKAGPSSYWLAKETKEHQRGEDNTRNPYELGRRLHVELMQKHVSSRWQRCQSANSSSLTARNCSQSQLQILSSLSENYPHIHKHGASPGSWKTMFLLKGPPSGFHGQKMPRVSFWCPLKPPRNGGGGTWTTAPR